MYYHILQLWPHLAHNQLKKKPIGPHVFVFKVQLQEQLIMSLFFKIFFQAKRKEIYAATFLFINVYNKLPNSISRPNSFSIKAYAIGWRLLIFSFNFKLIITIVCRASLKNEWPHDWFNMKVMTIGDKNIQ